MKEEWTDKLKTRLEHHEMTPPEGLWEGLSEQMGLAEEPVRKSSFLHWKRWAVAAAVAALAGFFTLYDFKNEPTATDTPQLSAVTPQPSTNNHEPLTNSHNPLTNNHTPLTNNHEPLTNNHEPLTNNHNPSATSETTEEKVPMQVAAEKAPAEGRTAKVKNTGNLTATLPKAKSGQQKWSFGLYASGGLLAANSNNYHGGEYADEGYNYPGATNGYPAGDPYYDPSTANPHPPTINPQRSTIKHHFPIRAGLKVNYQLSDRWALLTGVTYTYLYSEFSNHSQQREATSQRLHYVGVPLGLSYQLWKNSRFRVYASSGVRLEKCVDGTTKGVTTTSVTEKPWQWSVNAAVGGEYQVIKQLGIYLEPSLDYYFKDGTGLEHYYKEHPLSPGIEFGLRWHLNP